MSYTLIVIMNLFNITRYLNYCRWQARREGDRVMRAGLIPSRALQEGRIIHERQSDPQTMDGLYTIIMVSIYMLVNLFRVSLVSKIAPSTPLHTTEI